MAVDRLLPTQESRDLLGLVREIAAKELAPRVEEHERAETYPEGLFATLADAGLLGLPYPEKWGGGGQPYEVYLQVLEELASAWAAVAVAVSVQGLACHPLAAFGTPEQQERWLAPAIRPASHSWSARTSISWTSSPASRRSRSSPPEISGGGASVCSLSACSLKGAKG